MERTEKAGDILKRFFERHDFGQKGEMYTTFFSSWDKIVGTDFAAHSQITDIYHDAAVVEFDHPAWMQLFQMKQNQILRRIQKQYPDLGVKLIQMRLVDRSRASDVETRDSTIEKPRKNETCRLPEYQNTRDPSSLGDQTTNVADERLSKLLAKLRESVEQRDRERRT